MRIKLAVTSITPVGNRQALLAPVFTEQPSISGVLTVGSTLTLSHGAATGVDLPVTLAAVLQRGATVLDANVTDDETYLVDPADAGAVLTLVVTATDNVGRTTVATAAVSIAEPGSAGSLFLLEDGSTLLLEDGSTLLMEA